MGIEELQLNVVRLKSRELELQKEVEVNHDSLMIAIGEIRGYAKCQQEVEAKIKAELEAQKPKES